jgi:hypothetical protein
MIRTAKQFALWTSSLFIAAISAFAQDPTPIASALQVQVQAPEVTYFQLQRYLMKRISTPPAPGRPEEWNTAGPKLRKHVLEDIIYHGWPQDWLAAPSRSRWGPARRPQTGGVCNPGPEGRHQK